MAKSFEEECKEGRFEFNLYFCEDGNVYNIRFTTSRYWSYIKELRRIKKSSDLHFFEDREVFYNVRILHEKRVLSFVAL